MAPKRKKAPTVRKEELSDVYKYVYPEPDQYDGFFFSHGVLDQTPVLKLRKAAGIDELTLPVVGDILESLIQSEYLQKPSKSVTPNGNDAHKCWELQPNQILQKNKRWANEVNKIKPHIKEDLGLQKDKIRFTLNKILIYEPGSYFTSASTRETEKGMIGTLIVSLPSVYKGGDFVMKHDGVEINHKFGGESCRAVNTLFLAFYEDIHYEMKPITEGYRTCIIYNICTNGEEAESKPPPISHEIQSIFEKIERWAWDPSTTHILSIMAKHSYSENGLRSIYKLKAQDKMGLMRLTAACELFNYKYPHSGLIVSLQVLEVHKFTDKYNRSHVIEELENTAKILIVGPYDDMNAPVVQESLEAFQSHPIFPHSEMTAGKVVRREDLGPYGEDHPLEYWYRPSVMTILVKHKLYPITGKTLYRNILGYAGERTLDNMVWKGYLYNVLDGVRHQGADLQMYFLALVSFTAGRENRLDYMRDLIEFNDLSVSTFSPQVMLMMVKQLGWENVIYWHNSLATVSLKWLCSLSLTWSTLVSHINKSEVSLEGIEKERIIQTKDCLLQTAVSSFANRRKTPGEPNIAGNENEFTTLMVTLLITENPPKIDAALVALRHVPALYDQLSLPFSLTKLINKALPSYNIQMLLQLSPPVAIWSEMRSVVTSLKNTEENQRTLSALAMNFVSRANSLRFRTPQHDSFTTITNADIIRLVCPYIENKEIIQNIFKGMTLFPLSFDIFKLLSPFIPNEIMDAKILAVMKTKSFSLETLLPFINFDSVQPSTKFDATETQFIRFVVRGILAYPNLKYERFPVFMLAIFCQEPNLLSLVLEYLRKSLLTSSLHGYARQDPASFIRQAKEWAISDTARPIDLELKWLGGYINEEYKARIKQSVPSFAYDVDVFSYDSGFCDCKYCKAVIRFLKDGTSKEHVFSVDPSNIPHMLEVLNKDTVISPVIKTSQSAQEDGNIHLTVIKIAPLGGRIIRLISDQIEKIDALIESISQEAEARDSAASTTTDVEMKDTNSPSAEVVQETKIQQQELKEDEEMTESEPPKKKQKVDLE